MKRATTNNSATNVLALENEIQRRLHVGKIRMLIIHTMPNLCYSQPLIKGDADKALAEAAVVVLATVHNLHFYLSLMRKLRWAIINGRFQAVCAELLAATQESEA